MLLLCFWHKIFQKHSKDIELLACVEKWSIKLVSETPNLDRGATYEYIPVDDAVTDESDKTSTESSSFVLDLVDNVYSEEEKWKYVTCKVKLFSLTWFGKQEKLVNIVLQTIEMTTV